MITIVLWSIAAVLGGLAAFVLAFIAIRQRSVRTLLFAIVLVLLAMVAGAMAVFTFAWKSYARVGSMFTPRTGMEIYVALLGKPVCDRVEVTAHRDQVIPKLDTGISLRMRTCPQELRRLLSEGKYSITRAPASETARAIGGGNAEGPFAPEALGDTLLTFYWAIDPTRNWRWIYCNADSTEAICVDIFD